MKLCKNIHLRSIYYEIITYTIQHTINPLYLYTQSVPRSKHSVSAVKTSQLVLYSEIIAVCSENHTKHINTVCGHKLEFINVKPVGA
jgi:hypothetical protein